MVRSKEMTIELLKLPNVRVQGNKSVQESELYGDAKLLAWEVATKHPLWTIEAQGYRTYRVLSDGEELGYIGSEWHGSSQKLFVRNDRIASQNERKNAYHTDKVDKAYLRVKKTFGPMNLAERMQKAWKVAETVLENQSYRVRTRHREHERPIENDLYKWARANMTQYILDLKQNHNTTMLEHLARMEDVKADMITIDETSKAFQNQRTALIVLAYGKYIVKIRDNVQLYDDATFPVELRGKLGMLKLVENEQMVTGIGCRVNDEVFVIVLESDDEKSEEEI
jgi:hypothetical protein